MGVAGHLRIALAEYDARIRTFVPGYENLIATAARALRMLTAAEPTIVDLGIGTGALAEACLHAHPQAHLVGIDKDPAMLDAARTRLSAFHDVEFVVADFQTFALPACAAIVSCIALHHIPTAEAKRAFYRRCHQALRPDGLLVTADCFPARVRRLANVQREAWLAHLQQTCSRLEAENHLAAWAGEDVYFPLEAEVDWLREAGFHPEVLWREAGFATVAAFTLDGDSP